MGESDTLGKCFFIICAISIVCAAVTGNLAMLGDAVLDGAQKAVNLTISLAGMMCLWGAVSRVAEEAGATGALAKLLRPVLRFVFPKTFSRPESRAANAITAAVCANLLGLGNAATPLALAAMQAMDSEEPAPAGDDDANTTSGYIISRASGENNIKAQYGAVSRRDKSGAHVMKSPDKTAGLREETVANKKQAPDKLARGTVKSNAPKCAATDDMVTFTALGASSISLLPVNLIAMRRAAGSAAPYAIVAPVWICSSVCALLAVVLCRLLNRFRAPEKRGRVVRARAGVITP